MRLPEDFRFEGSEVHVHRVGSELVLSAVAPVTNSAREFDGVPGSRLANRAA